MVQGEVHAKFGLDPSSSLGGVWRQTNKQTNRHIFLFYMYRLVKRVVAPGRSDCRGRPLHCVLRIGPQVDAYLSPGGDRDLGGGGEYPWQHQGQKRWIRVHRRHRLGPDAAAPRFQLGSVLVSPKNNLSIKKANCNFCFLLDFDEILRLTWQQPTSNPSAERNNPKAEMARCKIISDALESKNCRLSAFGRLAGI